VEKEQGKEDKKQERKDTHDGRVKIKPKSDEETQVQRRQNLDTAVKELKGPEVNTESTRF